MSGATSGFGKVIAEHLVRSNYELVVLARSEAKMEALATALKGVDSNAEVHYVNCDLSSLKSVASACDEVKAQFGTIDLLILNAGLWNTEFKESADGIEETLHVNLLAPTLTILKLHAINAIADQAKVIVTASALHKGTIAFDNIEFKTGYNAMNAYKQSKLGVILLNRLFATLPEFANYTFYSIHPGIIKTDLARNAGWFTRFIFGLMGTSLANGAKTHIHLIDTPANALTNGEYYAKSKVTKITPESNDLEAAEKLLGVVREYVKEFV